MAVASDPGPAGSRRGLPRPPLRGRQPVRHPRQEGHHHAEGHPTGETDTRGLGRRRGMITPCNGEEVEQQQRMKGRSLFCWWRRSRSEDNDIDSENCAADAPLRALLEGFHTGNIHCSAFKLPFLVKHLMLRGGLACLLQERSFGGKVAEPRSRTSGAAPSQIGWCGHVSVAVFSS